MIYTSKHFLNENEYLNLATTKDMYQKAIPVLTIWINTNSKDKTSGIRFGNFQWRYNYLYPDNKPIEINEENSMMMVTEINLGEDIDLNKKDIYSYLYMLLVNSDPEKVIDTLYDYEILEKGEDEMFITPVEKEWKKEGIKEGLKEGIEKGIEKGEAQGIKKGSMETQTKMFFQLVNAIQKENSGITKNEAIERAKKIFELDEIPEIP